MELETQDQFIVGNMDYHDVSAIPPSLGFFADETSVHVEHWFYMWERISAAPVAHHCADVPPGRVQDP